MTVRFGLDYLEPLTVDQVKATGASFVCRYTSNLTLDEVKALSEARIDLVLLHETNPDAVAGGADAGELAAHAAVATAIECGMTGGRPIIFAPADLDISANPAVLGPYFEGVARVLPLSRIWGYQGYAAVKWLLDNRLASGAMQTAAWSAGQWDSRALIRQDGFTPSWDRDNAYGPDFGQWRYGFRPPYPAGAPPLAELLPVERVAALAYEQLLREHARWHPHHIAEAKAKLVTMRKAVWTAAVKGTVDGKPVTPGWDREQRIARYHALEKLTDWPPKATQLTAGA